MPYDRAILAGSVIRHFLFIMNCVLLNKKAPLRMRAMRKEQKCAI